MGIYMCMKSGCRVSGEDFARSKNYKGVSFYSKTEESVPEKGQGEAADGIL